MRRFVTIIVFNCLITFSAFCQPQWKTLPVNPNLTGTGPFDIVMDDNGAYYLVYAVLNGTTGYYDIQFDRYSVASGWTQLLTHPTTNSNSTGSLAIKTVRCNAGLFALATTDGGSQLTFFQIFGGSAYSLGGYSFPGFSPYSKWDVFSGSVDGELYFMQTYIGITRLFGFDYNTLQWLDLNDPFSGTGIYPKGFHLYADDDSVFVAGNFANGTVDNINLRVAQKGTWTWTNYSGNGKVFYQDGGVSDTVETVDPYFMFGKPDGSKCFIARDQGISQTFPVGAGTFGDVVTFPLDYGLDTRFTYSGNGAYIMAAATNLVNPHVVYERPYAASDWSLLTPDPYADGAALPSVRTIKTHPNTDRIMIGYIDYAPTSPELLLKVTNNAPTVLSDDDVPSTLCANVYNTVLTGLFIEDLDDDAITVVDVQSSNPSLIDPLNVIVSANSSSPYIYEVYADAQVGTTASQQSVTLTFTFTDGFDQVQYTHTYDVMPNAPVQFLSDTITICSNADAIDLNAHVSIPGGEFSVTESDFDTPYFDPVVFGVGVVDVYYMLHTGSCGSAAQGVIKVIEAPTAVIIATQATTCSGNDGSASLLLSGGLAPYSYVWNIGNFSDLDIYDLTPGPLHVDVVDANGCTAVADGIIEAGGASVTGTVTDISCYGAADGSIDITVTGLVAPLHVLWSNGSAAQDVGGLQPGTHYVYISDDSGCSIAASFDIAQPGPLVMELVADPTICDQSQGTAGPNNLEGGMLPYTYSWSSGETTDQIVNLSSGIYVLTVTDARGCTVKDSVGVASSGGPTVMDVEITDAHCSGLDGSIVVVIDSIGTGIQYDWSNGQNTPEIYNLAPGSYTLDLYNGAGCHSHTVFTVGSIAPERQQLCVITVDSVTSSNLLVWEKNDAATVDHFRIYRETATPGQFQLIDTVQNSNISLFNDVVASPLVQSWTYRISAVDACGVESVPSTAHKTIHLTAENLGGGDFKAVWNPYIGVAYTDFNVYRFTNTTGWELIGNVPSSDIYFVDTPPNTDGLDYMVDFALSESCTADVVRAQDFNSSRSNRDKGQFTAGQGAGGPNNGLVELGSGSVVLYPNPVTGDYFIAAVEGTDNVAFEIVSLTGQLILSGTLREGSNQLPVANLEGGLYILYLQQVNLRTSTRFVIR